MLPQQRLPGFDNIRGNYVYSQMFLPDLVFLSNGVFLPDIVSGQSPQVRAKQCQIKLIAPYKVFDI